MLPKRNFAGGFAPWGRTPSRLRSDLRHGKTTVGGLPDGEKIFTIGSAVLAQCQHVTQTDTDAHTVMAIAGLLRRAGKNREILKTFSYLLRSSK